CGLRGVPGEGGERALLVVQRSVPRRLAAAADRTEHTSVLRTAGTHAVAVMGAAGLPDPHAANHVMEGSAHGGPIEVAQANDVAPFLCQVTTAMAHVAATRTRLAEAGPYPANAGARER